MTRAARHLASLEKLLQRQHEALLTGDIGLLAKMPEHLERAISDATRDQPSAEALERITQLAAHNARLLKAAQAGIAQTAALNGKRGGASLTTYTATGQPADTPRDGRILARR